VLCYAESRRIHGMDTYGVPSRFLREIPAALLEEVRPRVQVSRPVASGFASRSQLPDDSGAFPLGTRVQHPSFGEGVVVDYEGSGSHTIVQVNFESAGSKRLVLAYAKLQAL
jgi:DNA helicase-2/ATP-dependent DNA helicase PcrA